MGRKAAPAVAELTQALHDPQVRIPALRAIEAAGPDGDPALPGIEPLLSNQDDFIRLSAIFPLVGIARPPVGRMTSRATPLTMFRRERMSLYALLRKALADRFPQVADAAAFGLFYCGSASAEALPFAIEALEKQNDVATKIIAGLGPEAASAVPALINRVEAANGQDPYNCQTLAAIGPAASDAASMLEEVPHAR